LRIGCGDVRAMHLRLVSAVASPSQWIDSCPTMVARIQRGERMNHLSWLAQALLLPSARWALGILFFVAAAEKLRHRRRFVFVVLSYQVLPKTLSRVYGLALPWLEAGVSLALLFGVAVRLAALLALTLLISFTIAILVNIARRRTDLNCGCFGQGRRQRLEGKLVIRNAILILLSLIVILGQDQTSFLNIRSLATGMVHGAALRIGWGTILALPLFCGMALLFSLMIIIWNRVARG